MIDRRRWPSRSVFAGLWICLLIVLAGCWAPQEIRPPVVAVQAMPREGYVPLSVTLDASASYNPDGRALTLRWEFGDGSTDSGRVVQHTFRAPGVYEVLVTAEDSDGLMTTDTVLIHVRAVPHGYMVRKYSWQRDGTPHDWELLIPYDLYQMYRGRLRVPFVDNYRYGDYVADPLDDPTLEDYATALWNRAGGDDGEFILETLAFVQGAIQYRADPPGTEHPLYPLETLADGAGDCEDTAILFVSLIQARGIPCKLAFVDASGDGLPNHVLAFVAVSDDLLRRLPCGAASALFRWDGRTYALAETAADQGTYGLGCDPWGIDEGDIAEIWSFPTP